MSNNEPPAASCLRLFDVSRAGTRIEQLTKQVRHLRNELDSAKGKISEQGHRIIGLVNDMMEADADVVVSIADPETK